MVSASKLRDCLSGDWSDSVEANASASINPDGHVYHGDKGGRTDLTDVPVKDVIIVLFMLGLWAYSIRLIVKAWSKIHNLPDSGLGGAMWKFVIDYIHRKRKETPANGIDKKRESMTSHRRDTLASSAGGNLEDDCEGNLPAEENCKEIDPVVAFNEKESITQEAFLVNETTPFPSVMGLGDSTSSSGYGHGIVAMVDLDAPAAVYSGDCSLDVWDAVSVASAGSVRAFDARKCISSILGRTAVSPAACESARTTPKTRETTI